jgi:hypothetical protein
MRMLHGSPMDLLSFMSGRYDPQRPDVYLFVLQQFKAYGPVRVRNDPLTMSRLLRRRKVGSGIMATWVWWCCWCIDTLRGRFHQRYLSGCASFDQAAGGVWRSSKVWRARLNYHDCRRTGPGRP